MLAEAKKVQLEIDKRAKNAQASFTVKRIEDKTYLLKDTQTDQTSTITVIDHGNGKADIEGLPKQLTAFLFNFTDKELMEDTMDVINVLITMYDSKGNG